ncbi:signal peptidase I [Streptomyces sp. CRN 30]|uniref:signal peptidase I n=1 Tax=Streptomyces sp. CRN 30 TaxID=3075613 RepID=UPI002A83FC7E|nr:signal peptidase I [Streptomyces sp. CRN 30]
MDTEAQHEERDRSIRTPEAETGPDASGPAVAGSEENPGSAEATSDGPGTGSESGAPDGRSRFALPDRIADRVPGGRITLTALVCLLFLLLLSTFVLQPFQIPSGSMESRLRIGDRVLVNKLAYRFGSEPQRGDVVVFDGVGYFGDADYVKRVVGVGGDHVVCCGREGRLEVNGRSVDESAFLYPGDSPSDVRFDVVVPDGALFVLGDHRSASSDSRDHLGSPGGGMVPADRVIGRADWIAWPLGRWTGIDRPDAYARVPAADGAHG